MIVAKNLGVTESTPPLFAIRVHLRGGQAEAGWYGGIYRQLTVSSLNEMQSEFVEHDHWSRMSRPTVATHPLNLAAMTYVTEAGEEDYNATKWSEL